MSETENKIQPSSFFAKILPRILKATLQALILIVAYFIFLSFMPPLEGSLSIFKELIDAFLIVYVFFTVASALTSGTIFQHAFNVGKSLFTLSYFLYALGGGTLSGEMQTVHFLIDLKALLVMIIIVCLIGVSKSLLQAIQFLVDKAEATMPRY